MYIFVYGTLKDGCRNDYLLKDSKKIGNAITVDKFGLFEDNFPYLIKKPIFNIKGEIYFIDNKKLEELDRFEGAPEYYERDLINVFLGEKVIQAFTYFRKNGLPNGVPFNEWDEMLSNDKVDNLHAFLERMVGG